MGIIKYNERFRKLFSDYLVAANKPSSTTYGGYSGYSGYNRTSPSSGSSYHGAGVHIFFYEWSTMQNGAKTMNTKKDLYDLCEKSKIAISEDVKKVIESSDWLWCTCVPGKSELMVATQYYDLSTKLENARAEYNKKLQEEKTLTLPCPSEMFY